MTNRLEIRQWVIRQLSQVCADRKRVDCHQQRVAVRHRTPYGFRADLIASTGTVLDNHRHRVYAADLIGHQSRQNVGRSPAGLGTTTLIVLDGCDHEPEPDSSRVGTVTSAAINALLS